jgi:hypothetical protein
MLVQSPSSSKLKFPESKLTFEFRLLSDRVLEVKSKVDASGMRMTMEQGLQLLASDSEARFAFNSALNDATRQLVTKEVFLKFPKVTIATAGAMPFKFAVVKKVTSGRFADTDAKAFYGQGIDTTGEGGAVAITSSSKTTLIIPKLKTNALAVGAHVGAFVTQNAARTNDKEYIKFIDPLWKMTFNTATKKLKDNKPFYLNTHGLAVAWLHVRFDSTSGYYRGIGLDNDPLYF